jgi:hypothetical protein
MRNSPLLLAFAMFPALNGFAQIQVSQEPRHHNVFENKWVRVLDVHIPPHDTSLMHKHSTPSVFMVLSKTKTGSQVLVEPGKPSFADGNIWFERFADTPRIHRVWNEDTVEFHVIDMELLHTPSADSQRVYNFPFSKTLFREKHVQAFLITLQPKQHFGTVAFDHPIVIVGLSGPGSKGEVNDRRFDKKGDFLFLPSGGFYFSNRKGTKAAQFAMFILY